MPTSAMRSTSPHSRASRCSSSSRGPTYEVTRTGRGWTVRPPPDSPVAGGPPRCTESRAAPIADTMLAGAALALFAPSLGAALSCSPNCAENAGPALSILSGAVLLATAGSAIYGFHETNRCAEARASWSEVNSTRPAPAGEGAADTAPPR